MLTEETHRGASPKKEARQSSSPKSLTGAVQDCDARIMRIFYSPRCDGHSLHVARGSSDRFPVQVREIREIRLHSRFGFSGGSLACQFGSGDSPLSIS